MCTHLVDGIPIVLLGRVFGLNLCVVDIVEKAEEAAVPSLYHVKDEKAAEHSKRSDSGDGPHSARSFALPLPPCLLAERFYLFLRTPWV